MHPLTKVQKKMHSNIRFFFILLQSVSKPIVTHSCSFNKNGKISEVHIYVQIHSDKPKITAKGSHSVMSHM